jgi:hypothetical protein
MKRNENPMSGAGKIGNMYFGKYIYCKQRERERERERDIS